MRSHKSTILIALVVLLLTALVAVVAQTPAQDPAKSADKKAESCCSDGSCPMMKKEGATANTDGTTAGADIKHDCCGDSCDMKKKDAMKNHANSSDKHEGCCCSDSCDMKNMKDMKKSS